MWNLGFDAEDRIMRLRKLPLAALLTICASSCSGHNSLPSASNEPVVPQTQQISTGSQKPATPQIPMLTGGSSAHMVAVSEAKSYTLTVLGTVTNLRSNVFAVKLIGSTCGGGYFDVHTGSATTYTGKPAVGKLALIEGPGNCATSISASHVTVAPASTVTLSGIGVAKIPGGFTLSTGRSCGYIHVYVSRSTTGSVPKTGQQASVTGAGSCSTFMSASSIRRVDPASAGVKHVQTADYLGSSLSRSSVDYASAAPFLTWAETDPANANAITAAGMQTMVYIAPFKGSPGNALYTSNSSTFALTCSGSRIYDIWDGTQEWAMNPNSSELRTLFANYVNSLLSQGGLNAIFEDNAGSLSAAAVYAPVVPGLPCDYSDSGWLADETSFNQTSPRPVVVNALSDLNGHSPSVNIALLNGSNTIGANMEDCYSTTTQPEEGGWAWQAMENTELQVEARNKFFHCMSNNTSSASSSLPARIYAYASFLLTYDAYIGVYRTEFATPSGFHVLPETEFVPMEPVVGAPSSVASLEVSTNVYARQYNACYLRGELIGACAVVVNMDGFSAHPFPYSQYHHTLALSGSGVLDGGTVSVSGSAPPSRIPNLGAVIALP